MIITVLDGIIPTRLIPVVECDIICDFDKTGISFTVFIQYDPYLRNDVIQLLI